MHLVLIYESQSGKIHAWRLLGDNKKVILQGDENTPAQIAEHMQAYTFTTTVLLMSPDVVVIQIPRPPGALSKIRQALPYLLEEQLMDDVENLHFTILNQLDHQSLVVAIVNRELLQRCLDTLAAVQLHPETVLPLWLALPEANQQNWVALVGEEYLWLRSGKFTGLAVESSFADKILGSLYNQQPPQTLEWVAAAPLNPAWLEECEAHNIQTTTKVLSAPDTWETYIAQNLSKESSFNLLQSEFSIKQQMREQKKSWKMVGMLVASIFAIWFGGLIAQYLYFSWSAYRLNTKIETIYQEIFPETPLVGNPRTVIDRELTKMAQGGEGTDFLNLLLRTGTILQEFSEIHFTELAYANKKLELSVTTDNFSRLKKLEEEFKNQDVPLEQENATSTNGVVQARLIIG